MSHSNLEQLYRQVIMDHYKTPRNRGILTTDAVVELNNPSCGDKLSVALVIEDNIIKDAKFDGEGCSISMSSASMMTQEIKGKTIEEALTMSQLFSEMMLSHEHDFEVLGDAQALEGVAKFPARIKCATLAWKALEKGIQQNGQATMQANHCENN